MMNPIKRHINPESIKKHLNPEAIKRHLNSEVVNKPIRKINMFENIEKLLHSQMQKPEYKDHSQQEAEGNGIILVHSSL